MVLPPEARFEVTGPVAAEAAAPVVGLEEFFGSSHASSNQDNVSLLDLSMAANQVGTISHLNCRGCPTARPPVR